MDERVSENILKAAIKTFGEEAQTDMMIEECSELTKALLKLRRSSGGADRAARVGHIREEIADVQIMLNQMKLIFGQCEDEQHGKMCNLEVLVSRAKAPK